MGHPPRFVVPLDHARRRVPHRSGRWRGQGGRGVPALCPHPCSRGAGRLAYPGPESCSGGATVPLMDGYSSRQRWGTLVVPLIAVVVLCFLCALCYPGAASAGDGFGGAGVAVERAVAPDSPDEPGFPHTCPTPDEQGLLTAQPMLAFGSVLVLCVPVVPRAGPSSRRSRRDPASPHGYRLLTLLCVQRV